MLFRSQAVAAQAVALAAGPGPARVVAYTEVAPAAMMLGSTDLLRAWVAKTLGGLAADDEHHARLRDTLLVFLRTGGSYKATAERLTLHKNTVQYRVRRAEESLGRPVGENRPDVELAAGRPLAGLVSAVARQDLMALRGSGPRDHRHRRRCRNSPACVRIRRWIWMIARSPSCWRTSR